MAEDAAVRAERHNAVELLVLDRPRKLNAFDLPMLTELDAHLAHVVADREVKAVVLTGGLRAFSAGADIRGYVDASAVQLRRIAEAAGAVCRRLAELPVPTVAAVHGLALGGGFEVVLACDLVVAAEDAQLGLPETELGLIPGWGGTQRLTRLLGVHRALELILTAGRLDAAEAHRIGVVNRVRPVDDVVPDALAWAEELASRAPHALAAAKTAVRAAAAGAGEQGFVRERELLLGLHPTADGVEGCAPSWGSGRRCSAGGSGSGVLATTPRHGHLECCTHHDSSRDPRSRAIQPGVSKRTGGAPTSDVRWVSNVSNALAPTDPGLPEVRHPALPDSAVSVGTAPGMWFSHTPVSLEWASREIALRERANVHRGEPSPGPRTSAGGRRATRRMLCRQDGWAAHPS
ncbi:enoyl-CoA hydratase/isomerase family protein [Pseudonocardia kunmingensis]|uniref:enoyl-CoA hydratase/isomerase family protein n=1 Tax=Pseudonocardia kunmingensis TaxID=630975 RepID=UPI002482D480|nr:enoyl-CoA hydratase/isomerase family protein [Pseudonocardia kunmingensis]